ncbi:MAG: GMC family oxidoreductase N-terminal domain-containing protein [Brevundimonas sp.]|uniref:GMC family oxidoreductase N-terminal domain-containing protein n=1 Tax=Brevundimonas sp. TaxID=1871086 RepID=UPI002732E28D|nr:GMC family oxidoreductase N-terminal domain-containing protein [Brevundimonas sp.]MDP3379344.1 GMC family oxidoreductase N-terminal domain-containing protein [Brevundimonas sp.]
MLAGRLSENSRNRVLLLEEAPVIGGCSSVNVMDWVRGQPDDYDRLVAPGNPGW